MKLTMQQARVPLGTGPGGDVFISRPWMQYLTQNTAIAEDTQSQISTLNGEMAYAKRAGSYFSRSTAALASAAGFIPADVVTIHMQCYESAFDDGAASYSRISQSTLDGYALSADTLEKVTFADGQGGYWILDEITPHVASVGGFGQALGTDPAGGEDQAPYFNALSEYLSVVKGGGVIRYGWRNYYCATTPYSLNDTGLLGPANQGRDPRGTGGDDSITSIYSMPGPVLADGITWGFLDNCSFVLCTFKRSGMTIYDDMAGALDFQVGGFAGTALASSSSRSVRGLNVEHCNFYGFAYGINATKCPGSRFYDVYGDCVTLVKLKQSGETVWLLRIKRKPVLSTVEATRTQEIHVTAVFDSGGKMGCTLEEDITGKLQTGERVGNNAFPSPYDNVRSTVTVLSGTTVQLDDIPYSSFTIKDRTSIAWQPGASSSLTGFYNAGGYVGVQTVIDMPFQAGHKALIVCATTTVYGFWSVRERVSATDFVLDVAWDAALSGETLSECELTAMPNERVHSANDPDWGTAEGFGVGIVACDGVHIDAATKGGGGIYLDCSPSVVALYNEGGTVGPADTTNPTTRGAVVVEPRTALFGVALKSSGTALQVAMGRANDNVSVFGSELVDGGRASFELITGGASLFHAASRGPGRTIFTDIDYFLSIQGELRPDKIRDTLAADIRRTHWMYATEETWTQVHSTYDLQAWDASGNQVTIATGTSDAWEWEVPVTSTPKTVFLSAGAVDLAYPDHHEARMTIGPVGVGFTLDANTVPDGFHCTIRNAKGSDYTLPTTWGTGATAQYALGAAHTKLKDKGWLELWVDKSSGSPVVCLRGDTA